MFRTVRCSGGPRRAVRGLPLLLLLLAAAIAGCGDADENPYPVRASVARQTLEAALELWKSGQPISAAQQQNPPIVVQDLDWMAEAKLKSFSVIGEGTEVGANLSVAVTLELVDSSGKASQRDVWYLVGTDPALTVFRDMFHSE